MLVAIYLLWSLLGDAKVDLGRAEEGLEQYKGALVLCQDEQKKLVASQQASDQVVADNQAADVQTDNQTQKLLKQLREQAHAKKCVDKPVGETLPDDFNRNHGISGLDRLLDTATCTAKQNGIPCTPGGTSAPL